MLSLTTFERATHRMLLGRAGAAAGDRQKALVSYGELGDLLRPMWQPGDPGLEWPFSGFFEALGHTSMYEVEHGRPMLSALVVNRDTGAPGEGFIKLARHLGFEVDDEQEFWATEVQEVLDTWRPDATTAALDRGIELLDERLRAIQRSLRRGARTDGAYLAPENRRHLGDGVKTICVVNVGAAPAVEALYVGDLHRGYRTTGLFNLRAGEVKELDLVPALVVRDADVLGERVNEVAEVLIWGDGTGRWLRSHPQHGQVPAVWMEGAADPPHWMKWYREVRHQIVG